MRRREFIALMGASVASPLAALAQQGQAYRLGVLFAGARSIPTFGAMIEELRQFGFIEGKNLTIDFRSYASHTDLIPEFAADLVKAAAIKCRAAACRISERGKARPLRTDGVMQMMPAHSPPWRNDQRKSG